jgi:hypothetical protein
VRQACLVFAAVTACAGAGVVPDQARSWNAVGYEGFGASIDALVGPEAIDCGYWDLMSPTALKSHEKRRAFECVRRALRSGAPFKFGTVRIPLDSYSYEVVARASDGRLWMITFDIMIDDTAPQQWNRICEKVRVDARTLFAHGVGCVAKPDGRLEGS